MADFLCDVLGDENFNKNINMLKNSESDEEPNCVSRAGESAKIERHREKKVIRMFTNYFRADPTYPAHVFDRRFPISRAIFTDKCDTLQSKVDFFKTRKDLIRKVGLHVFQKCTSAMRQLAYGTCSNAIKDYVQIRDITA